MTTIHLVFKTHLDIGFTDYAANVVQTYYQKFIPHAMMLARRTREREQRFRWTTGAWLIYTYLEQASAQERAAIEDAINAGDIVWHALPFTTHSELIDDSLWRFALSYGQTLDRRFGRHTIAAKLTDVPGHTRALVPLLAEAGIRLLHIGLNPASSVPDVPPVFVWRDRASSTEIMVIYHDTYGGVTTVFGLDDALALFLTGDNEGPPSEQSIAGVYETLRRQIPGAKIVASTLDEFSQRLETVRASLPVLTSEIGDTWIHGAGTDPTKISQYRELARLRRSWLSRDLGSDDQTRIECFSHSLLMIPEHTWGMDEKTHLPDHTHYFKPDLALLRQTEAAQRFETSWAEQRAYLETAVRALAGSPLEDEAREHLAALTPRRPDVAQVTRLSELHLSNGRFDLRFDPSDGAIIACVDQHTGMVWADAEHPLASFRYEVFGSRDYERFWMQYIRNRQDPSVVAWAREDFTKPGLPLRDPATWKPTLTTAYQGGPAHAIFALALPDQARSFGAPDQLFLQYSLNDDRIEIVLSWFDKPACRQPEAFWLAFQPPADRAEGWRFEKLGRMIDPRDVVSRAARTLHAIDQRVIYADHDHKFELESLDAPLVAPGQPALLNFHNELPDMRSGVHVNLYNNVWGTNFPMWFEGDAQFRFVVRVS